MYRSLIVDMFCLSVETSLESFVCDRHKWYYNEVLKLIDVSIITLQEALAKRSEWPLYIKAHANGGAILIYREGAKNFVFMITPGNEKNSDHISSILKIDSVIEFNISAPLNDDSFLELLLLLESKLNDYDKSFDRWPRGLTLIPLTTN